MLGTRSQSTASKITKCPEYKSYTAMMYRCYRPGNPSYESYGGSGVVVCEGWRESFANFLEDMGRKPSPSHSIERIDGNKGYGPQNCRWATKAEQAANRSSSVFIESGGERMCVSEWARKLGMHESTIYVRIKKGWPLDRLLSPARAKRKSNVSTPQLAA